MNQDSRVWIGSTSGVWSWELGDHKFTLGDASLATTTKMHFKFFLCFYIPILKPEFQSGIIWGLVGHVSTPLLLTHTENYLMGSSIQKGGSNIGGQQSVNWQTKPMFPIITQLARVWASPKAGISSSKSHALFATTWGEVWNINNWKAADSGQSEFSSVQSLSHVQLFVTPWTAAF